MQKHINNKKIAMNTTWLSIISTFILIGVVIVDVENFSRVVDYWELGLKINWKLNF